MLSESLQASFHRTHEGAFAARVGDLAFLAAPEGERFRVRSAWRFRPAPESWTRREFPDHGTLVDDEAAFIAHVETSAEHCRQLQALGRREVRLRLETPWGSAQQSEIYAEGVTFHSTAGHGGLHLDPARNALVDRRWRSRDGWYEEDSQWAIVAGTFPELFTRFERACAEDTLRHSEPDAYEAIRGVSLESGQSRVKDERAFKRDHAKDWIVISAITSRHALGFVECVATIGANAAWLTSGASSSPAPNTKSVPSAS